MPGIGLRVFGYRQCLALALLIGAGLAANVSLADVYKVVDEQGNTVYTDRAPTPDAVPLELLPLNELAPPPKLASASPGAVALPQEEPGEARLNSRQLRSLYRDFRIIHPVPGQVFRGESTPATVAWETQAPLEPGMRVVFHVDGRARPPTREQVISTGWLDRGDHVVRAELLDHRGQRVARTEEIPFRIHKEYHWINLPGPRIR